MKLNFKRQVFLLENILEMIPIHRLKYRKVGKSIYQNIDDDRLSSVTKIKEIFILFVSMVCIFLIFLWLLPITCKIKLKINTQISRDVFNTSETDKKTITQRTGWVEANKKYEGQETADCNLNVLMVSLFLLVQSFSSLPPPLVTRTF